MSDTVLPTGVALTAIDETFREDPYPILRSIQEATRVLHDDELGRYVYTSHDDVKAILRDKDLWSDPRKAKPGTFTREFLGNADEEPSMLLMDEPDHRRLRMLVSKPFTPAAVQRWRSQIEATVQVVLDQIDGEEFDLIQQFAGPVPTIVIARMLGIDESKVDAFKQWSDTSVQVAFNPFSTPEELAAGEKANEALNDFFAAEIETRRSSLGDDLISDMLRAEEEGETLSVREIIGQCNLLLIAGNVTTTDLIGNGVKALLDNPDQLAKLRADPSLIENAVEEMLRFDSPVTNSGRIANRTIDIGGCPVHEGESLSTSLAAANHDPDVYPDPDKFDIEREDTHHQSFGGGRHLCLGAHLARLEAQVAILGLLDRYPVLEHAERGHTYAAVPSFRGMAEFWVLGEKKQ
ncbi:MAG: cytochrome P450 [Gammaproteobacteria bacterium]|nr:MAG: cytochrome P450 [Gammaproteobacteria bacterium]